MKKAVELTQEQWSSALMAVAAMMNEMRMLRRTLEVTNPERAAGLTPEIQRLETVYLAIKGAV